MSVAFCFTAVSSSFFIMGVRTDVPLGRMMILGLLMCFSSMLSISCSVRDPWVSPPVRVLVLLSAISYGGGALCVVRYNFSFVRSRVDVPEFIGVIV